jgi:Amt family ammonium transporter
LSAFVVSLFKYKQYDLSMFLNGVLGGLVGVTAGADVMSVSDSIVVGFIAGALIVLGVALIDKLKLDDPVGAIAVHLICGVWGTLAVGIFGELAGWKQFGYQLIGVIAVGSFCLSMAYAIIKTLKVTIGIRVSSEEEQEGLDIHEHGMDAYPDFRLNQH